jgi:large conductance mechanosensitive channel
LGRGLPVRKNRFHSFVFRPTGVEIFTKEGQVMPDLFEQLKQKYQPVLDTIREEGAQLRSLSLDGSQLCLKATAKSEASKNRILDAIKTIDPEFADLKHDIHHDIHDVQPVLSGFKQFLVRGNFVDMAVGVVVGAAFTAVGTALTKDLLTPLIAALFGKPDFSAIRFTVNGSVFALGDFINALVSFVLVAVAMYFLVIIPVNTLISSVGKELATTDSTTKKCPECLSVIPIHARRCSHCTQILEPGIAGGWPTQRPS